MSHYTEDRWTDEELLTEFKRLQTVAQNYILLRDRHEEIVTQLARLKQQLNEHAAECRRICDTAPGGVWLYEQSPDENPEYENARLCIDDRTVLQVRCLISSDFTPKRKGVLSFAVTGRAALLKLLELTNQARLVTDPIPEGSPNV